MINTFLLVKVTDRTGNTICNLKQLAVSLFEIGHTVLLPIYSSINKHLPKRKFEIQMLNILFQAPKMGQMVFELEKRKSQTILNFSSISLKIFVFSRIFLNVMSEFSIPRYLFSLLQSLCNVEDHHIQRWDSSSELYESLKILTHSFI